MFLPRDVTGSATSLKNRLVNIKMQELNKKYNTEKKLILNHPLATKQMKRDQMKALNKRYRMEKQ
jgi:membrane protein insertase Oxa1/YidC/SpoIIIJ